jgi:hypothetical protein
VKRVLAVRIGVGALVAAVLVAGLAYWDRRASDSDRVRELKSLHESLRRRLESHVGAEPLLAQAEVDSGDVVVAIRTPYMGDIIRDMTRRYLDRVTLDLQPDIHVHETGELKKKTFLGTVTLGVWDVKVDIARLQGMLSADAPHLEVAPGNSVRMRVPVSMKSGRGSGTLEFTWTAKGVTNMVCRDFTVREDLEATVFPEQYRVRGGFTLAAEGDRIVARPLFPRDKHRVRVDLTPESWDRVKAALVAQDTFGKCGIAMEPEDVLIKLRKLGEKGFEFRLPPSLFRPVELPAGLHSQAEVEGRKVEVQIESRLLSLTPEVLWYGADIHARLVRR